MVSQGFFSGSASAEKRRFAGEKENNANLSTKVEPVKLASLNYPTGDLTKPYVPDEVGDYLKDTKYPDKTVLDSSGDYFTSDPKKDGVLVQRRGDDMRFSQSYDRDEKGELTKNYQKEYASYLKTGDSYFGSGLPETTINQLAFREKPKPTIGSLLGFSKDGYIASPTKEGFLRMATKDDFDKYRRDLVNTAAEKSIYGADVEVGPKRFVEGTGFDEYKRNPDFTYTKTGEKYNQLQDKNIPKGEGYFFKDFYKPGEFRTKEDLNRYLTDRGAYMTRMPSNFEGGISGKGEKTDDLTSMYRSTAGDEKTRLEKAKEEQENRNILQRVGDFVGDTFNKLTGTQAAEAGTLQTQGINTSATTNIAQMGGIPIADEIRRDARAMANLRRSGLDKTVGGQSSQPNYGSGRTGGFGTGTHGRGMPSNPAGMRQKGVGVSAGNLSRHKAGPSTSRSGVRGGTTSRSRGGVSRGGSKASSSGSRGQGGGTASRSKGGSFGGSRKSTNTSKSRRRCDIRTKIDIAQLTNTDLFRDDLADVAYFVKEIK